MLNLDPFLQEKLNELERLFREMESVVVAFSGGVDSTLVLKLGVKVLGPNVKAVTALSATMPAAEVESVKVLGQEIGVPVELVETDQLQVSAFVQNDASRCFHCKTDLYRLLDAIRARCGFRVIVDGTNLDDVGEERPGIRAAREWRVRSPLMEAGVRKSEIRQLAKAFQLTNWDKPAAACLSSRIARGIPITRPYLARVEEAESVLKNEGFGQVRVRLHENLARIEVAPAEMPKLLEEGRRKKILLSFKAIGFRSVTLDLEGYRPGGGN